ncbi:MAG TPA: hypothetical protein VIZ65_18215 [Cellvibrionaceae bacterium]
MVLQNKKQQCFKTTVRWLRHILVTASMLCCACTISQAPNTVHASTIATKANFQLSQSHPAADINFSINYSHGAKPINIIVSLDAVVPSGDDIKLAPEYYLTATIFCADGVRAIKSTTFAPYPMWAEGKFVLALPQAKTCFKSSVQTTILNIKLQLKAAKPSTSFTLTGNIEQK